MQFLFHFLNAYAFDCPKSSIDRIGTVDSLQTNEISGIGFYREQLYVHNDSGDEAKIYVMNVNGDLTATHQIDVKSAIDWEDMAIGSLKGTVQLFVGDIGDNEEKREHVLVHALPIDNLSPVKTWTVTYESKQPRDAEGLAFDPIDSRLYILTKGRNGTIELYQSPILDDSTSSLTLQVVALFPISENLDPHPIYMGTALDISPDGTLLIMRNYLHAYLWQRDEKQQWKDVLKEPPCKIRLPKQRQGESLAFRSSTSLMTISEGKNQSIFEIKLRFSDDK
jgi:hypothetical protein